LEWFNTSKRVQNGPGRLLRGSTSSYAITTGGKKGNKLWSVNIEGIKSQKTGTPSDKTGRRDLRIGCTRSAPQRWGGEAGEDGERKEKKSGGGGGGGGWGGGGGGGQVGGGGGVGRGGGGEGIGGGARG